MKVVAVIPAYKESERITNTIQGVSSFVDTIIVVDDGSCDGTKEKVISLGPHIILLEHALNRGQGAALRTGNEGALKIGADIIVHIDADGQHDPACIPALIQPLIQGTHDIVFGSRFLGSVPIGIPKTRLLLLQCAKSFNAFFMGIPKTVTDPQSGIRAMTRFASMHIPFRQDRMAHCSEILQLVTCGSLRWKEVPVDVRYTEASVRKGQRSTDALKIVWHLLIGIFA